MVAERTRWRGARRCAAAPYRWPAQPPGADSEALSPKTEGPDAGGATVSLSDAVLVGKESALVLGDQHARRIVRGPAAGAVPVCLLRLDGGLGGLVEHTTRLLNALGRWRLSAGGRSPPRVVAVSLGGNALTSWAEPHQVAADRDPATVAAALADILRRLVAFLWLFGAPSATVVLLSVVPRAHLSDADLVVFRRLSDVQRAVAREMAPRCVLLDVERLLAAELAAPGSWRRRLAVPSTPLGSETPAVRPAAVDVWSVEPLPRHFPRLGPLSFAANGVHLHTLHYGTIRAAMAEEATVAALLDRPLPQLAIVLAPPAATEPKLPPSPQSCAHRQWAWLDQDQDMEDLEPAE
ncbi:hypothetical protein FJT64_020456 [Amphibalanus amphitrite]|uniref:Uncharacterized protein n=1 Tax=Amphibalanus amphitrite TaxID=1232801 RepID=A0A6A4WSS8_AMPAM|nr:hypothetical protein FJT64_020456 [Amphibalanus amphitrite]